MVGKRGQNEGSIYQLADGRWRAVMTLGYVWEDGKRTRKRKNVEGKTRGEVAAKLVKMQRDAQQGIAPTDDRIIVKDFLAEWLARDVKHSVRARTYESYASSVKRHIVPAIGTIKLTKLTPRDVQGMVKIVADKDGCSMRTADYQRIVLRIALNRAMKWEMVVRNVAALVGAPKMERSEIRPLDVKAVKTFLAAVRDDRHEALFIVATALGLRKGEVLGLAGKTLTSTPPRSQCATSCSALPENWRSYRRRQSVRAERSTYLPSLWMPSPAIATASDGRRAMLVSNGSGRRLPAARYVRPCLHHSHRHPAQ